MPDGVKLLDARKALTAWLVERPQNSGLLFPNPQGGSLSRIAVYNLFKKHAKQLASLPTKPRLMHSNTHSGKTFTIVAHRSKSLLHVLATHASIPAGVILI